MTDKKSQEYNVTKASSRLLPRSLVPVGMSANFT